MNQILVTKENHNYFKYDYFEINKNNLLKQKKNYLIFFLLSSIICFLILIYLFTSFLYRIKNTKKTSDLVDKYNIISTYPNSTSYNSIKLSDNISIIGLIEIPKIEISYPIISNCTDDLLKISICKFSGPLPNKTGNMCLAGHNYKNSLMFSKLDKLNVNDSVFITDLNGNKLEYLIFKKSKIGENNLDEIKDSNSIELTLITCNSINNSERIMIKAKAKE